MRPMKHIPAPTALALDLQLTLPMPSPSTPVRPTQPGRPTALLRDLYRWITAGLRPAPFERGWISPALRGWEAPTDILARRHTYLYMRSMSG